MRKDLLSVVCVDDEYPALELLESYIRQIPDIVLKRNFVRADDALVFLKESPCDLVILDIQMPLLNGMELLQQLRKEQLCIFVTADPNYAVKAYELNVIDYLVKPVTLDRFRKAIRKAMAYHALVKNEKEGQEFVIFKSDYMIHQLKPSEIRWVEGAGEYLKIITRFRQYMVLQRMSEFEEHYRDMGFVRIHKSYLVWKNNISSYHSQAVFMKDGKELPIGRAYKGNLE